MDYDKWTDALAAFWLAGDASGPVVLALEPSILIDVAASVGEKFDTAEDAAESFVAAIQVYQRTLGARPWRAESVGGRPRFLLLIAIQVFAASRMDDDTEGHHTKDAYYVQLESLVSARAMSANFAADHGDAHRSLWRTMQRWLSDHGRSISLPSDAAGTHERNVGLPKSQALLRIGDLADLPLFFRRCRYQPNVEYSLERVSEDADLYCDDHQAFPSRWARAVLNNRLKFATACRQIHDELQLWDGQWEITNAGRRNRIHDSGAKVWFGIHRKKQKLVSRIGTAMEQANLLSKEELADVLNAQTTEDGLGIALHRGLCLCRFDSDDVAFKQVSSVEPGDRCLFAVNENQHGAIDLLEKLVKTTSIVKDAQWYLAEAEDDSPVLALEGVPTTCVIVEFHVVDPLPYHEWVDSDWCPFLKSPAAQFVPTGGLRFGREWNWVVGAGPSIRIVGNRLPKTIEIAGFEVAVDGRVVGHPVLSDRGEHRVRGKIDGLERECTVLVSDPVAPEFDDVPERAWAFSREAPAWQTVSEDDRFLRGARLFAPRASDQVSRREERQAAIRILAGHSTKQASRPEGVYNHPLTRCLVRTRVAKRG